MSPSNLSQGQPHCGGRVKLTGELEVTEGRLHLDSGVVLALEAGWVDLLEHIDRLLNTLVQLGEGRLVVLHGDVLNAAHADGCELGAVRARLDLEWQGLSTMSVP